MDFRPTEDQRLLQDGVRGFLAGECTTDHVRAAWRAGVLDDGRWKGLAGLGVVGLTVPEARGGMGLDDRDLAGLLVEAGYAALPEPVAEVTGVAVQLLVDLGGELADATLPRIATGDTVAVPALPDLDPYPAHLRDADLVLVGHDDAVWAVAPEQLQLVDQPTVDGARPTTSCRIPSELPPAAQGPHVADALARAAARGATTSAAMMVGAGLAMIDLAVAHATQREQFGRPIGTFQAVQHHLASALVDVQFARPLVERAAHALATGDPAAPAHASTAKAFATEAAEAAARHSLQVHGAIGYTWECDLHLWMKRVWSLAGAWGDTEHHWQRVEQSVLGG